MNDHRAAKRLRTGTERAIVEAVFDLADAPGETRERIAASGLESDDGDDLLYVGREITRAGKSQCRVNGRLCPLSTLREICEGLVDVHSQHEHQSLLQTDRHVDIVDDWLGLDVVTLRSTLAAEYSSLNSLRRALDSIRLEARERARSLDLYRFQQNEIVTAALQPGEEETIEADRSRLANAGKLRAWGEEAYNAIADGALDGLNSAVAAIEKAADLDETVAPILEQLNEALSFADDARRALRNYRETVEQNPERLEELEERIDLIQNLKRKYGETIEDILRYGSELTEKLDALENQEAREESLIDGIAKAEKRVVEIASRLTKKRRDGSAKFAQNILRELSDLGMAATRFEVSIEPQPMTSRGADKVVFLLSPNPGEPLRPLAKIASGGETSRLMLAMKSVLARTVNGPTLIFDEIDVGVGGRTAVVIAQKLSSLADVAQILCITHLPQIASQPATRHFSIEKSASGGRTTVHVESLTDEARVDEIARMLGGAKGSATVVQHAREMLKAV